MLTSNRINVAALLFLVAAGAVAQEQSVVLKQTGVPLELTSYRSTFQPENRASTYSRGNPDQIGHSVFYKNVSPKEIVAVQIGFASFDAFNGFMGRFNGWATETVAPGASRSGEWSQRPYAAFAFKGFGTGVAFVNAVRFNDGTIWRANLAEVLVEMQKFEKELKREDLVDPRK